MTLYNGNRIDELETCNYIHKLVYKNDKLLLSNILIQGLITNIRTRKFHDYC